MNIFETLRNLCCRTGKLESQVTVLEEEVTALQELSGFRYVFEGDSFFAPPTIGVSTPDLFRIRRTVEPSAIINNAVSGQTTTQMVAQYPTESHLVSPGVTGIPAWIFFHGGINDIFAGATAAAVYANLVSLWASARADGYLVCAVCVDNWTTNPTQIAVTRSLNTLILSDPSLYDAVARWDLVLTGYRADWYVDSVHPNETGRRMLAATLVAALEGKPSMVLVETVLNTVTPQVFAAATPARVAFAVVSDTAGRWATDIYSVPVTGDYMVVGRVVGTTTAGVNDTYSGRVFVNAVPYKNQHLAGVSLTAKGVCFNFSQIVSAVAGDTIDVRLDCPNSLTTVGNNENGFLTIKQLPPKDLLL